MHAKAVNRNRGVTPKTGKPKKRNLNQSKRAAAARRAEGVVNEPANMRQLAECAEEKPKLRICAREARGGSDPSMSKERK
jgi:hypothetical protein